MGGLVVAGLLPFVGVAAVNAVARRNQARAGIVASLFVAASLALVLLALPAYLHTPTVLEIGWIESLGVSFSILADGLSLLFALLICGIGLIVFTYAAAYLGEQERRCRFFSYLLTFMGAMLGVVLSANLIALFVFWELTSISSFLLIGFWHERERSRNGALKALVVTSTGGLAMLVGFVMIGIVAGSFEIPTIIANRALIAASPWATPAAVLVMLGAMTKSAQMPFHLWLPSAMEAPTPVSAYLHAATMVKAGLYLVARLGPALADVSVWTPTLTTVGLITMTWASFLALRQRDLKALLAFSTVSQLGLIMSLLADPTADGRSAGLLHLLNHGVFKGALFLLVGVIEHEAHTRDLTRLGPLYRQMPRTWVLVAIAALSMAGLFPFGGFVSKELFMEHVLGMGALVGAFAVFGAILTVAYCLVLAIALALGRVGDDVADEHRPHDAGAALLWGPAALVAATIALGVAPAFLAGGLVEAATAAATAGPPPHLHLALWHGFTKALAASSVAIVGGLGVYTIWWRRSSLLAPRLWADRTYDAAMSSLEIGSRRLTAAYMSGLLWRYVSLVAGVLVVGLVVAMTRDGLPAAAHWPARPASPFETIVAIVAVVAGIGACRATTRLAAILALGANGFTLALLFSLLEAPDLALTQVMVETISVALFVTVFVFLPAYRASEIRTRRPFHLFLSACFGFGMAGVLWLARGHRAAPSIAEYFVANSVDRAGGHNVVNVILVDFRGLDTLGEITVLAVAALACYAIIRLAARPEKPA